MGIDECWELDEDEEYISASEASIPDDRPNKEAARRLCYIMSEISEDHYAAGWLMGLEFSLFSAAFEGTGFGDGLTTTERGDLFELSHRCDGWWRWQHDEDPAKSGRRFTRMSEWTAIYQASQKR